MYYITFAYWACWLIAFYKVCKPYSIKQSRVPWDRRVGGTCIDSDITMKRSHGDRPIMYCDGRVMWPAKMPLWFLQWTRHRVLLTQHVVLLISLRPSSLDLFSRNILTYFLISRHVSLNYFIALGRWLRWYATIIIGQWLKSSQASPSYQRWSRHFKAPSKTTWKLCLKVYSKATNLVYM